MKIFLYLFITLLFTACSVSNPSFQEKKESIIITANKHSIELKTDGNYSSRSSGCIDKSLFFETKEYQVEYIKVDNRCTWTGLPDGLYQDFLRKNIKGLEKTASFKIENGDIYKFEKEDKYFYFISLYDALSNTFLIDYTGEIVSTILEEQKDISLENRFAPRFQKELLENHMFKGFFESKRSEEVVLP